MHAEYGRHWLCVSWSGVQYLGAMLTLVLVHNLARQPPILCQPIVGKAGVTSGTTASEHSAGVPS
jgi:hypothetical protein